MARLTQAQTLARQRLETLAPGSPEQVASGVAAALEAAIGWDGYRIFGIDPGTRFINRVLASSEGDGPARDEWLRDVYLQAPRAGLGHIELGWLSRAGLRAVAFQDRLELCHGYPDGFFRDHSDTAHARRFQENHAPVGGTILVTIHVGDRWVAAMQAYRRDVARPFRASDIAFVRLVAPRMGELIQAALDREAAFATTTDPGVDATGIVLIEPSGRIRYATPAGEAWIDALRSIPGEAATTLPSAVWGVIAGLGVDGQRAMTSVRLPGTQVSVEATSGGDDASVAVVITPVRSVGELAPPPSWGLTSAEERVATLVIQGHPNRVISDRLSISEHTVEWHLRRIFEKLDLRSRGQLAARYFHETGLPGVVGTGSS